MGAAAENMWVGYYLNSPTMCRATIGEVKISPVTFLAHKTQLGLRKCLIINKTRRLVRRARNVNYLRTRRDKVARDEISGFRWFSTKV